MKLLTTAFLKSYCKILKEDSNNIRIMSPENKRVEGPACACGKVDIYKEMLKSKKDKLEVSDLKAKARENDSHSDEQV